MWITEKEAVQKRCIDPNMREMCLGSDCMAWRTRSDGKGYCGLAGVPYEVIAEVCEAIVLGLTKEKS